MVDQAHQDSDFMRRALALADIAAQHDEVPVGAVIVSDGKIIGEGYNQPISSNDPTAHAEVVAMRDAAQNLKNYRISNATLYVTIEPCTMCFGSMMHARIERLVYGASEPRAGVIQSAMQLSQAEFYNHRIEVTSGVLEEECGQILKRFFAERR